MQSPLIVSREKSIVQMDMSEEFRVGPMEYYSGEAETPAKPSEDDRQSYFVFPCLKVTQKTMITLTTIALCLSLFMERYCFIVTVYKTKYFGYVLIMTVLIFNCLFHLVVKKISDRKPDDGVSHLHEVFKIERKTELGCCIFALIGVCDMFYAFFVFWPANTIPMWLLVTLLQFFIPLNMFIRHAAMKLKFHRMQLIAGVIIMIAVLVNFMDLLQE